MKSALRLGGIALVAVAVGFVLWQRLSEEETGFAGMQSGRVAVEVASIGTDSITDRRELTGTLEPDSAFTVAPNISGRIQRIHVDIGDAVQHGDLLVELDDAEARQNVAEADAMLAVARAEHEQSISDAELAEREFERTRALADRDLASQSELDAARARAAAERSAVAVAQARMREREAARQAALVRLSYTEVRASWPDPNSTRVVGERLVSTGDNVAANTGLLTILAVDPLKAVIHAPERDFAAIEIGQPAHIQLDALPATRFDGQVARIAPRFDPASRQARVEIRVPNTDNRLRPGMFITAGIDVAQADDVTVVPLEAVIRRDGRYGVFLVEDGDPPVARFHEVQTGIESDDWIEIVAPAITGRVITLGQQMLEDGTEIHIVGDDA